MNSHEKTTFLYRGMEINLDKASTDKFRALTGYVFDAKDADLYIYNHLVRSNGRFPDGIEQLEIHEIENIINEGLFMENIMREGRT